jgi:oligopeptide/dipeptide ABC transporter ATP-binding protein
VGWQIVEMIRQHDRRLPRAQARARAVELLTLVGIPQAGRRVDDYPHQFSGGMRQRAMIAMAMALNPRLLIADEPTTALDVTVQAQVLQVIRKLQEEFGTAVILITHDLGVVADVADDVIMMYAGAVMEQADLRTPFSAHHHPYIEGLLLSLPAYSPERERLRPISGQPPSLITLPGGCPFHPRCPYVMDRCRAEAPPLVAVGPDASHLSACWLPHDRAARAAAQGAGRVAARPGRGHEGGLMNAEATILPTPPAAGAEVLLRVEFHIGVSPRPLALAGVAHAVQFGAELLCIGLAQVIEDDQGVAPGGAGGGVIADGLVCVADVGEGLGLDVAAAGLPEQIEGGPVAVDGLVVVAELLVYVADAVPYLGLTVLIAEFAQLAEAFLAICQSLLVVREQGIQPAHVIKRPGLPALVADLPVQIERGLGVAECVYWAGLLVQDGDGGVDPGLPGVVTEPSAQVQR